MLNTAPSFLAFAGRGIASNHKGGNVIFKADEPGYIFCITSLTPRVDYFQGNDWDLYLNTMDDLHKPQLDGIGFQDRLYQNINASAEITNLKNSIGKQPAWIEYMTNVNKTYGNLHPLTNSIFLSRHLALQITTLKKQNKFRKLFLKI